MSVIVQSISNNNNKIDYLCVLDFEATCDERTHPSPREIIEFPTLLYDVKARRVVDTFHVYILPDVHPKLSRFCTQLTGIEQNTVDNGISLTQALTQHIEWIDSHNLVPIGRPEQGKKTFVYLTCGDWDLKTGLPSQLGYHGIEVPDIFRSHINVKAGFAKTCRAQVSGMKTMMRALNLQWIGRHHSGIDDCRNIAQIVTKLLERGWTPVVDDIHVNRRGGGITLAAYLRNQEKEAKLVQKHTVKSEPTKSKSQLKREKLKRKKEQEDEEKRRQEEEEQRLANEKASDPVRRAKKIKKMLRQIEELKEKTDLDDDQKAKLATEGALRLELEKLNL